MDIQSLKLELVNNIHTEDQSVLIKINKMLNPGVFPVSQKQKQEEH